MKELVEVKSNNHSELKVHLNSAVKFANKLHIMNLRVDEIGKAVSSFPVFFMRDNLNGHLRLSILTSFEANTNVYVENDQWTAVYKPSAMQTYPFYLMRSPNDDKSYTVGIDESNPIFSKTKGDALFDEDKNATPYLHQKTKLLEAELKSDMQSYEFIQCIESLNLIKLIDVKIAYEDGTTQTLKGLSTINEDKLQGLNAEQLFELNKKGYLSAIHAMLVSIYQLNTLIIKNNNFSHLHKIKSIKLEVTKANHT
ncbi:SapC family protein [Pseudocolwellia sp. AS88]|uniref:SapC family protein n=1 Tax=Pseudocolwellia sp. AS88 TaxID=3063958 RepID=UPI0026ECEF69|nr:SapC family protein [Pseudocolwellia sp. AS88]MDO7084792.1 SapC family protein [Pseudocolwellia sp. AS88]